MSSTPIRLIFVSMLVYAALEMSEGTMFRKRQLVVGRVGFRPGRSLAIGRGALLKPSGKRAASSLSGGADAISLAPSLEDVLVPGYRSGYCSGERQELADVLFANVVQAMQELRQFANICYGSEEPSEMRDQLRDVYEVSSDEL